MTHDLVRYVQVGRADGRLTVGDEELTVTPSAWWGERDHSWGMRPLPAGGRRAATPRPDWRFLLFLPVQFEDFGLHLYLFEDGDGHATHLSCGLMGTDGSMISGRCCGSSTTWPGSTGAATPTLVGGTVVATFVGGREVRLELAARPGRAYPAGRRVRRRRRLVPGSLEGRRRPGPRRLGPR